MSKSENYKNKILLAAKAAHQINKTYCESIGDYSQENWEQAEQWQRDSAISGVDYLISHPLSPPSFQHDMWMKDKLSSGWKYGPVKDATKKEHPCIVEYDDLPAEQKAKDALFQACVRGIFGIDS